MSSNELNRFSRLNLRAGKQLQNRVVVPAMASETADPEGLATAETISHYARLAESGAGLVIVEYSYVHFSGRSEERQLGIQTDHHIVGLSKIAQAIHGAGAIAGIQLTHAGGKTTRALTGGILMGPGSTPVPVKDREMERPDPMSLEQIELWKQDFSRATFRAVSAGFDLVEFHSAHGYGLNQWLSPLTNRRTDQYGGDLTGNSRLLLEIIREARSNHPELLLSVRIPGQDFLEGGLRVEDSICIAQMLENQGVDIINVSSGIGGWRRPRDRVGEGYLIDEAKAIQAHISKPVIGVGGIQSAGYIDRLIETGQVSLAAVGRAILEGPMAWREEVLQRTCA